MRWQLAILRGSCRPDHQAVRTTTRHRATILHHAGELEEAEMLFRETTGVEWRISGRDHTYAAGLQAELGQVPASCGDLAGAEASFRDALRVRKSVLGPEHFHTAQARSLLGMVMWRQGDHAAANSTLTHALDIMERSGGRAHRNVREVYGWPTFMKTRGLPAEARRYRAVAAAG